MDIFTQTQNELRELSLTNKEILVSYSGGKDSLVVLDLCSRHFKKVICLHMYFIPGLEVVERQMQFARERYGVEIIYYPHWVLLRALKQGIFTPNYYTFDDLPEFKLKDIYTIAAYETGIPLIATGYKKTDSMWRRRNLSIRRENIIVPIKNWNKFDVLAYLKIRGIPLPPSTATNASGIDLSTPSLLWLHDNYPDDFKKLLNYFPYAEAVVKRREYYGIH